MSKYRDASKLNDLLKVAVKSCLATYLLCEYEQKVMHHSNSPSLATVRQSDNKYALN